MHPIHVCVQPAGCSGMQILLAGSTSMGDACMTAKFHSYTPSTKLFKLASHCSKCSPMQHAPGAVYLRIVFCLTGVSAILHLSVLQRTPCPLLTHFFCTHLPPTLMLHSYLLHTRLSVPSHLFAFNTAPMCCCCVATAPAVRRCLLSHAAVGAELRQPALEPSARGAAATTAAGGAAEAARDANEGRSRGSAGGEAH
jgi:hypothetical protein